MPPHPPSPTHLHERAVQRPHAQKPILAARRDAAAAAVGRVERAQSKDERIMLFALICGARKVRLPRVHGLAAPRPRLDKAVIARRKHEVAAGQVRQLLDHVRVRIGDALDEPALGIVKVNLLVGRCGHESAARQTDDLRRVQVPAQRLLHLALAPNVGAPVPRARQKVAAARVAVELRERADLLRVGAVRREVGVEIARLCPHARARLVAGRRKGRLRKVEPRGGHGFDRLCVAVQTENCTRVAGKENGTREEGVNQRERKR